jgi:hypothetical protein
MLVSLFNSSLSFRCRIILDSCMWSWSTVQLLFFYEWTSIGALSDCCIVQFKFSLFLEKVVNINMKIKCLANFMLNLSTFPFYSTKRVKLRRLHFQRLRSAIWYVVRYAIFTGSEAPLRCSAIRHRMMLQWSGEARTGRHNARAPLPWIGVSGLVRRDEREKVTGWKISKIRVIIDIELHSRE